MLLALALVCSSQPQPSAAQPGAAQHARAVPSTMQKVEVQGKCSKPPFSCVKAVTAKTPRPTLGTVLVKLSSSSVNPSDVDQEQGGSGTLGVDFAGTVVELGPAVKRLKVGDRVWGVTVGAYAEYITVLEAITGLVPPGLPMSVAGTIPEVAATSLQCLQKTGAPFDRRKNITVVLTR